MRGEQVVSGIVVVSRIAEEGGERQFGIELGGAIESLQATDAVMLFGLSQEQEDREVKARRGGGQFIEGVAVNKALAIAIGSPRRQSGRCSGAGSRNDRCLACSNRRACAPKRE